MKIQIEKIRKMIYKIEKISDDKFNGNHPNGIFEGYCLTGHIEKQPVVGERFHFGTDKDHPRNHLFTSVVTKILTNDTFKTRNSTYKLEKIE